MRKIFIISLKIAMVVGTILNFINQFQAVVSMDVANISFGKLALNYCVPFLVSLYSSLSAIKQSKK